MTGITSGTLGHVQLLAFVHEANNDAIQIAATQSGLVHVELQPGTVVEATEYLKSHASPETLLVEVHSAEDAPAQLDALADVLNPLTKVIVCGTVDSVRFYHWLMDIGIHEYLLEPFTEMQLATALHKGAAKKTEPAKSDAPRTQKLIAVIGARGGAGTTTMATNLAALFAREHGISTGLFDLDPHFGSVALSLDLEAGRGMRDALEKPDRVDGLFLERVMMKPFPHLSILSSEEPLSEPLLPHINAGELIFTALKEKFDFVVVDLPRQMNPVSRYVLAHADHTIIVAEPQLLSLRDALRLKDYLVDYLKRPAPLIVLNRVGLAPKHELPLRDFSKHYGAEPTVQLPYLSEAIAASAEGGLLIDAPKIATALAPLHALAATLVGRDAEQEASSGSSFFSRLKGKK